MTATTVERNTKTRAADDFSFPIAASVKVLKGTIAYLNTSGYVEPAITATGKVGAMVVAETVDNSSGAAGALQVPMRRGCWKFANSSSADAITNADYGATCYVVDNQTVAKTNGTNTRSAAGTVRGVDADGVWVEF